MIEKGRKLFKVSIYLLGILLVSLGIVLCKKSALGISPVSSIPLIMNKLIPLSFGTTTMLFHLINILLQMCLLKKIIDIKLLMQIPLAIVFGKVINWIQNVIVFWEDIILNQYLALIFSVIFTAAGMVCMIRMQLIQNPPDGLVKVLSQKTKIELGKMKIIYDWSAVAISSVVGFIVFRYPVGFGIGTIVSAIFVGKTVTWMQKVWDKVLKND